MASTPQMRERYLETILERAGELERLIELLFSYSTMDFEGVRPKMASLELVPYLQGLRDSLAAAFPAATINLVVAGDEESIGPPPRMLCITADVELTRRVMSNLVENAVKHGGKPAIVMQWRVGRPAAEAGGAAPSRAVEAVVSDYGAGVAPEDLSRIFEPFFRTDRARSRQHGGSGAGLGLSIVSRIMQAQGGSVRGRSVPAPAHRNRVGRRVPLETSKLRDLAQEDQHT